MSRTGVAEHLDSVALTEAPAPESWVARVRKGTTELGTGYSSHRRPEKEPNTVDQTQLTTRFSGVAAARKGSREEFDVVGNKEKRVFRHACESKWVLLVF